MHAPEIFAHIFSFLFCHNNHNSFQDMSLMSWPDLTIKNATLWKSVAKCHAMGARCHIGKKSVSTKVSAVRSMSTLPPFFSALSRML